ncbi:hypothetical protein EV426DRAFT_719641 [Tirmania nivea]|nr:hypothetical protein EV426DRAFT_719641 [Tirmania nivea]
MYEDGQSVSDKSQRALQAEPGFWQFTTCLVEAEFQYDSQCMTDVRTTNHAGGPAITQNDSARGTAKSFAQSPRQNKPASGNSTDQSATQQPSIYKWLFILSIVLLGALLVTDATKPKTDCKLVFTKEQWQEIIAVMQDPKVIPNLTRDDFGDSYANNHPQEFVFGHYRVQRRTLVELLLGGRWERADVGANMEDPEWCERLAEAVRG